MRRRRLRPVAIVLSVAVALTFGARANQPLDLPLGAAVTPPPIECSTTRDRDLHGLRPAALSIGVADGEPLSFEQSPPVLTPDFTGTIQLRRFMVVGDIATIQFRRIDPDNAEGQIETWERSTTTTIGGRLVSIFEPSWPDAQLAALLRRYVIGFDYPELYVGSVIVAAGVERQVRLRVGFSSLPLSPVQRISDRVQYASNVVNLVVPDFEDTRVAGGLSEFNFETATRLFYQSFPDDYDSIAIIPAASAMGEFGAFHRNVRNAVSGVGIRLFNQGLQYGSAARLQGIELFGSARGLVNSTVTHEFAHQWGDDFNWSRLAGVSRAGHQPTAHAPLWWAGETMIGAVLTGDRRVRQNGGAFEIERTSAPIRYHPIELYSMGLIGREDVPDVSIFDNQGQFSATTVSRPDVGTVVEGETHVVHIDDIIREHGGRSGPVPGNWRRATVVVSREALLTQGEMDYWNFFAQRIGDRNRTGVLSIEGFASPFVATDGRVSVSTSITPLTGPSLPETFDIESPAIGRRDLRGMELLNPAPTRYRAGETVSIAGRVTAAEPVDFNQVLLRFTKYGGTPDEAFRFSGAVSRNGDFTVTVRFTSAQTGRYILAAFLFWPNAGTQFARTILTPIVVE
jgi:hypothetical protein